MGLSGILLMCIYPFLDQIQDFHNYWHGDYFKMPHFFQFLFSGLSTIVLE